ncbi:39290_t:CDS:1, partial [Gigaspora margarita]
AKFTNVPVKIVREIDEKAGFNWKRENSLKVVLNKTWNNVIVFRLAKPNRICCENRE